MKTSRFYRLFALISIGALGTVFLLFLIPGVAAYKVFSLYCLALLMVLTIVMYHIGRFLAAQSNPQPFTAFSLSFGFIKILLLLLAIVLFVKLAEPQNRLFLLPFFSLYLIFTVFETYCLMQLGKNKPGS